MGNLLPNDNDLINYVQRNVSTCERNQSVICVNVTVNYNEAIYLCLANSSVEFFDLAD